MDENLYVHLSEMGPVYLADEQYVSGFHALAGLRLDAPPASLSAADWRARLLRFLLALGYADEEETAPWWTCVYHLRIAFAAPESAPLVSLWTALTAPSDWQAESAACDLCGEVQTLLPPELEPREVCTAGEFAALWGKETPPMLWEILPAEDWRTQEPPAYHAVRPVPDWAALQQVILLCRRLPGPVWLDFAFLPVHLPEAERAALRAWGVSLPPHGNRWWLLRQTVAGGGEYVRLATRALAAAQTYPGSRLPARLWVTTPVNAVEWQAARANWTWGVWRPWGEPSPPENAPRMRRMLPPAPLAALLAPWCLA